MASVFAELKRRNVFRVAVAYLVIGWLLLQISDLLFDTLGLGDGPKKLILGILALGFLPTLLFSWAFELTPEGIKREKDIQRDQSITNHTAKKLDIITLFAVLLLLGMIVWQQFQPKSAAGLTEKVQRTEQPESVGNGDEVATENSQIDASIAVLPFADLSSKSDQEYFSDGIAEEILNVLVKVSELEVASRTSSFQFKGRGLGIPEIARKLKVRHVLEGSVRKAGDTIRITAQLIEAQTDKHLWSETYDRPLTAENIFAIQDEIANAIVQELGKHLGIAEQTKIEVTAATDNLDAYELFLKARPLFQSRYRLDEANELLIQALDQDPNFVQALEIRAALQSLMVEYGYSNAERGDVVLLTNKLVDKAISIEPNSATALAVRAKLLMNSYQDHAQPVDMDALENDYDLALEIDPRNASALNWRGLHYNYLGFKEKGLQDFETCVKYDPLYTPCRENKTDTLSELGRYKESLKSYIAGLNNSSQKTHYAPLEMLAALQEEVAFKSTTNSLNFLYGWPRHEELYEAYQNLTLDHTELAKDIKRFASNRKNLDAAMVNSVLMSLGEYELLSSPFLYWGKATRGFRQSRQFKQYITQSGILAHWQKKGFPPQCRALSNNDFECD